MIRFKILYFARVYNPWELHEWHQPKGWFKRGWWSSIFESDTKEDVVKHMRDKVAGEEAIAPAYFDDRGTPEYDF